jgi:two-component system phosphate regulon response regulator OmpR
MTTDSTSIRTTDRASGKPGRAERPGPRVLLVDDNDELRATLAASLSEEGVDVTATGDPVDARELVATMRFDAVIVDLVMPGTHGMALLADIRNSERGQGMPAVVLSALPDGDMRLQARKLVGKLKHAAFLDKPASPRRILLTLGRVLSGR